MVRLGLARSCAFNTMIGKGLKEVLKEVVELKRQGFALRHGGLTKLLDDGSRQCFE